MNDKEKKAFVARMKKGKKDAAKGKSKTKKGGAYSKAARLDKDGYTLPIKTKTGQSKGYIEYNYETRSEAHAKKLNFERDDKVKIRPPYQRRLRYPHGRGKGSYMYWTVKRPVTWNPA